MPAHRLAMHRELDLVDEAVTFPAGLFSLEKFRDWAHSRAFPRRGRISWLAGSLEVDMSREELETHNKVKGCLFGGIHGWLHGKALGDLLANGAFLVNEEADLATEPDLLFCKYTSIRRGKVRYAERKKGSKRYVEVVGSPDLVVEVVSESSVRKDTVRLRKLYHRARVKEYWIVDARGKDIRFRMLLRRPRAYSERTATRRGFVRSEVLKGAFRIARSVNPVGGYSYELEAR
jgi:Uma2 family endonuclease